MKAPDETGYEYRIEISYQNGDFQKLRYPAILVDNLNADNGIAVLLESFGFCNNIDRTSPIGWVKNGATFADWKKVKINENKLNDTYKEGDVIKSWNDRKENNAA